MATRYYWTVHSCDMFSGFACFCRETIYLMKLNALLRRVVSYALFGFVGFTFRPSMRNLVSPAQGSILVDLL